MYHTNVTWLTRVELFDDEFDLPVVVWVPVLAVAAENFLYTLHIGKKSLWNVKRDVYKDKTLLIHHKQELCQLRIWGGKTRRFHQHWQLVIIFNVIIFIGAEVMFTRQDGLNPIFLSLTGIFSPPSVQAVFAVEKKQR